ncbi:mechanosensitive ion channel [Sphingobacterium sp. T2]|uniref:mechanosensitive ion channel n=1 Tax=Sphingobacterium sp. T2 TaxID=1590596 RepID=UPI00068C8707|nr:mechanosensitive ion channel [Sphingobacterium sp. T2]
MNTIVIFILKVVAAILFVAIYIVFPDTKENAVLLQAIKGGNTFLIPSIILSIIRFTVISLYNARHAKKNVRGNFVLAINRVTSMVNAVLLVIAIMVGLGINPIEFVTSLTIVAMAIAVLFRDYITNLLSGLFYYVFGSAVCRGPHQGGRL